ncbi:hypothetical protein CFC21_036801 [Triticum aestivum]|uniref:Uncharacterized protein n=2 Tax=Triticum aestivum TaxID=4565 RepID=A0A3B6EN18_WHEAT|nr:hypothetical protein CFC21_036801 [Triticum aestivum]
MASELANLRLFGSEPQLATPKPFSLLTDPTEKELAATIDLLFPGFPSLAAAWFCLSCIYEMQELFTGTSADGSLAMDQHTCTIDSHDSDNDEGLYDLNCYPQYDYMRALLRRILTLCQQHMVLKDLQFMYVLIIPHLALAELSLQQSLAAPAPQMPQVIDPYASLWHRLEVLPITMDQRVTIGMHLSSKNNEGLRGWLCCASDKTFETWVWKFFDKDDV